LALKPQYADALSGLGSAYLESGKLEEAELYNDRALAIDPNLLSARWHRSNLRLLKSDFERGWQDYELRWETGQLPVREFVEPRWNGQYLADKTILLYQEQGFGDTFQFIRYAAIVKQRVLRVLVQCDEVLLPLLARCAGVDQFIAQGTDLPRFDVQTPLLSLPRVLKTTLETIPANIPYIFADPTLVAHWRNALPQHVGFRIGVNWHGREGQVPWLKRNIPRGYFADLASIPGVRLISLQREATPQPVGAQASDPILDVGPDRSGAKGAFVDTAAIMMNLDLVITSDTSIAHLAGALGVPVWVALPLGCDWRWLLARADSPWYPTMRLFRQKVAGNWITVFTEIKAALHEALAVRQR
jgi:hypothetical protein